MGRHDITLRPSDSRAGLVRGLYASTPVLTAFGWQALSDLGPGDLVMTLDLGLQPVVGIVPQLRQALWSVRIPQDALGNPAPVMLPPGQPVLVDTPHALPFSGDALALVPVTALEGWRGIAPHVPAMAEPILGLHLDRAGVIFVGPGLLTGCEGVDDRAFNLRQLMDVPSRPVLPLAAGRQMAAQLVADETGSALARHQAADLRVPPNLS